MASRGIWRIMSARMRRGLALSWSALFVLSLLLQYLTFATASSALAANTTGNKLLGGFEVDGDFPSGTMSPAGDDWSQGASQDGLVNGPSVQDPLGNGDATVLSNGVSDGDSLTEWDMNGSAGAPQKADMGNVYVATRPRPQPPTANSHFYTYIGIERKASTGTVQYDLEFNHLGNRTNANGVSVPNRSTGDLLFTGTQQGGGSWVIQGSVQKWTGAWNTGSWSAPDSISDSVFYGLANEFDAAHPAGWSDALGDTIPANQFAEMAIDVSAAAPGAVGCPGFGTLNIRSISSTGQTPELKDVTAGVPIDVSNCATLKWAKEDGSGNPLGGATFTVDPNPFKGTGAALDIADYVSASAQSDDTKDQDKRAGFFKLINVVPGTYTVTEKSSPAGYILDDTSKSITLSAFEDGSISYVWQDPAMAHPTLTTSLVGGTTANGKSTLTLHFGAGTSASFADSAVFGSMNANHKPTGNVVYHLYDDANCSHQIDSDTVAIGGTGLVPDSKTFTLDAVGTYSVVATYAGDTYNVAAHNDCGDEVVTLPKNKPSISTSGAEEVGPGESISDSALLSGTTAGAGGTITFNLYGPGADCSGDPIFSATADVDGDGTYGPVSHTPAVSGTYHWIASYDGDARNAGATGACGDEGEDDTVTIANPSISTEASGIVVVGGAIADTAHLTGSYQATGTITFTVFLPGDTTCQSGIVVGAVAVDGDGFYPSPNYTATQAGTYRWIASYGGDGYNTAVSGKCNDESESVVVTPAQPTIETVATEGGIEGDLIHDTATVSGGYHPTGTVTFKLYGGDDPTCDKAAIFTSTTPLENLTATSGTATSGTFPAPSSGTYHWIASYNSGDANNMDVAGTCGALHETTTIRLFSPSITTVLHSGNLANAKITVLFGSAVTDQATLADAGPTAGGNVTYKVYSDSTCETLFASAGTKAVTNGSVPASDPVSFPAAGTYYWQAHYSGDLNNAPSTSACTDEVVTVTTPNLDVEKLVAVNDGELAHSGSAQPGDTLQYQVTIANSGDAAATNVPVSDDISAILDHATYNDDCSNGCSFAGDTLSWTIPSIAAGGSVTLTFSVTLDAAFPLGITDLPNVVVVIGPGSNCAAQSEDAACATDTTVSQSSLVIEKALTAGNTGGTDPILNVPAANIGDTLTYTLHYTGDGPLTHAVITDVLPDGLAFVAGSALGNADFGAGSYDASTRTITWEATAVDGALPDPADGTLTYQVKVLQTAPEFAQPLENVATIDSAETEPVSDTAQLVVVAPPLGATGTPRITLPPTDTLTPEKSSSNPGYSLMLILLGLAGLAITVGFMTPVPERVRRRDRQG